jgi:hypothetical protein
MRTPAVLFLSALLAATAFAGPLDDGQALEAQGKLAEARGRYEAILRATPGDRAAAIRRWRPCSRLPRGATRPRSTNSAACGSGRTAGRRP